MYRDDQQISILDANNHLPLLPSFLPAKKKESFTKSSWKVRYEKPVELNISTSLTFFQQTNWQAFCLLNHFPPLNEADQKNNPTSEAPWLECNNWTPPICPSRCPPSTKTPSIFLNHVSHASLRCCPTLNLAASKIADVFQNAGFKRKGLLEPTTRILLANLTTSGWGKIHTRLKVSSITMYEEFQTFPNLVNFSIAFTFFDKPVTRTFFVSDA